MPYKSSKQRAYLHIHHPELAKKWDRQYGKNVVSLARSIAKKKGGR